MPIDRGSLLFVGAGIACCALLSALTLSAAAVAVSIALAAVMLAIAAIDAQSFRIPDILSLPAIPAGLLVSGSLVRGDTTAIADLAHVAAAVVGATTFLAIREAYWRLRGREGLGLGDVKLAAVAGAWTGPQGLIDVVLVGSMAAIAIVVVGAIRRGDARHIGLATRLPLGAALAPAIWLVWWLMEAGLRA